MTDAATTDQRRCTSVYHYHKTDGETVVCHCILNSPHKDEPPYGFAAKGCHRSDDGHFWSDDDEPTDDLEAEIRKVINWPVGGDAVVYPMIDFVRARLNAAEAEVARMERQRGGAWVHTKHFDQTLAKLEKLRIDLKKLCDTAKRDNYGRLEVDVYDLEELLREPGDPR